MISLDFILQRNTVGIFDFDSAEPVFEGAEIMRINALDSQALTQYPVESGQTRTDGHRVRKMGTCTVDFIINRNVKDTFYEFKSAFLSGKKFIIQTRAETLQPYVIAEIPRDELPQVEGAVGFQVRFQEWLEVSPEFGEMPARKVASPQNSDTVRGGQSTGTPAPSSLLNNLFGGVL